MNRFVQRRTITCLLTRSVLASLLLAAATVVMSARPAAAANYLVTTAADTNNFVCDADCSLREAIYAAIATPADDTITFDPAVFATPQTIVLSGINITVTGGGTLEIIGPGAGAGPAGNRVTVSGNGFSRVLTTTISSNVTIRRVNFTSGNGIGSVVNYQGGAIFNTGTMVLDTVQVSGSSADNGGGIANWGALTLSNSIVTGNTATNGGGVSSVGTGATVTMTNSSVVGNVASGAGVGFGGGGLAIGGAAQLSNVTIANNTAVGSGGGVYVSGSTTQQLLHTTISGNTANLSGGGVYVDSGSSPLYLVNSIVWRNSSPTDADVHTQLPTRLISPGKNLVGVAGASQGWHATDRLGVDAMLAPLSDNGGGVPTMVPLIGSPAIDKGANCVLSTGCGGAAALSSNVDARGFTRPIGFVVDIGAAEMEDTGRMIRLNYDNNVQDDVLIDLGGYERRQALDRGLRIRLNDSQWIWGTGPFVDSMVAADLNADGYDEVLIDEPSGLYIARYMMNWQVLHPISPRMMTAGNLDGVGGKELVVDFGAPYGIWIYANDATWTQLHPISPLRMITSDLDGNGRDELIVDFGPPYGIWIWRNNTSWEQLHPFSTHALLTADVDGNGRRDLVIDFGPPYGLWIRYNDATWTQLHPISAESIAAGDLDGDGRSDLAIDFGGPYGLWLRMNNSAWQQLHLISPEAMVTADLDGNGRSELVIDFGEQYGVWTWRNNASWSQLSPWSP